MSEIVAAFGLRRDGQWDVEHLDGRKEVVCSREMDRRGITVQNSDKMKMLQERATAAEKRAEEAEAQAGAMREALEESSGILYFLVTAGHYAGDKELLQRCEKALTSNPGRSVQERMKALEETCVNYKATLTEVTGFLKECVTILTNLRDYFPDSQELNEMMGAAYVDPWGAIKDAESILKALAELEAKS